MSKEKYLVLFSYTALAFFAYRNCLDIFIPAENYAFLYNYANHGKEAIFMNARESGPRFVAFTMLFYLYKLLGTTSYLWIVVSISLHIIVSFVICQIAELLLNIVFEKKTILLSFFCGLIFLLSPYQTENLLWTPINTLVLFNACATLAGIYLFLRYLENAERKKIIAIHVFFLLGIFSYEYILIFPLIYVLLYILIRKIGNTMLHPKDFTIRVIAPQVLIIFFFFLSCKIVNGTWFYHAGTLDEIVQTPEYLKTLLKYFAKFFLFYRYLTIEKLDEFLRVFSKNGWSILLSTITLLLGACLLLWKAVKINPRTGYFLITLLACFLVSLIPVLPLDSSFLKFIYPDRYGYLPSLFFYLFLVAAIYVVFSKYSAPLLIGYSALCWVLLARTLPAWSASNEQCNNLTENYRRFVQYERVYVLNVPTYYRGVVAFRSAFAETMAMKNQCPLENIRVISGCYQESAKDTITSVIREGNSVTVQGPKMKTPFFSTNGGWAKSYETEEFKVVFDPSGCSYTLIFKQEIPPNSAFIYTSLGSWKKAG